MHKTKRQYIYNIRFGNDLCTYTTAFRKYIRDDLTIKEKTETRIAPVSKSKEP